MRFRSVQRWMCPTAAYAVVTNKCAAIMAWGAGSVKSRSATCCRGCPACDPSGTRSAAPTCRRRSYRVPPRPCASTVPRSGTNAHTRSSGSDRPPDRPPRRAWRATRRACRGDRCRARECDSGRTSNPSYCTMVGESWIPRNLAMATRSFPGAALIIRATDARTARRGADPTGARFCDAPRRASHHPRRTWNPL